MPPGTGLLLITCPHITRAEAEAAAENYYQTEQVLDAENPLDATRIKNWAVETFGQVNSQDGSYDVPSSIPATPMEDWSDADWQSWTVLPGIREDGIVWIDPAGYEIVPSEKVAGWESLNIRDYEFTYDKRLEVVSVDPFV